MTDGPPSRDRTRVVFVDMQPMLRDIVRAVLEEHDDIEVVGQFEPGVSLKAAVDERYGEVVITDAAQASAQVRPLLDAHPKVRVFAVGNDGRETFLWRLQPASLLLGEISPQTLLDAVRG